MSYFILFYKKNIEHTIYEKSDPNIIHLRLVHILVFYTILNILFPNNVIYFLKYMI
jgi:hypothetical protein